MGFWKAEKPWIVVRMGEPDFKEYQGYRFDKRIFRVLAGFLVVSAGLLALVYGVEDHYYVSCPEYALGGRCSNPLYGTCDNIVCRREWLAPGEALGEPPAPVLVNTTGLMLGGVTFAFLLNHFWHNKRYAF